MRRPRTILNRMRCAHDELQHLSVVLRPYPQDCIVRACRLIQTALWAQEAGIDDDKVNSVSGYSPAPRRRRRRVRRATQGNRLIAELYDAS